jgi:hypothetical protein
MLQNWRPYRKDPHICIDVGAIFGNSFFLSLFYAIIKDKQKTAQPSEYDRNTGKNLACLCFYVQLSFVVFAILIVAAWSIIKGWTTSSLQKMELLVPVFCPAPFHVFTLRSWLLRSLPPYKNGNTKYSAAHNLAQVVFAYLIFRHMVAKYQRKISEKRSPSSFFSEIDLHGMLLKSTLPRKST